MQTFEQPGLTPTASSDPLLIAGVDEAGRGPLAGPVAVAAVILDPRHPIDGLDDSKRLTPRRREQLFACIIERAVAWHIEHVGVAEIDRLNILHATLTGMRRALEALRPHPLLALIDGNRLPLNLPCPAQAIIGGDRREAAISAASILAKVSRDRYMRVLDRRYPGYDFSRHKGYPTRAHIVALQYLGPCPEHRRSFAPVRAAQKALDSL